MYKCQKGYDKKKSEYFASLRGMLVIVYMYVQIF